MAMAGSQLRPGVVQQWLTGSTVKVKTSFDEEILGEVFSYDADSELLMLKCAGDMPQQSNLHLLRTEFIAEVLSMSAVSETFDLRLPFVDEQKGLAREEKAIYLRQQEAAKIGVGVTEEAQAIFLALAKTMLCKWDGTSILVLDEVLIVAPYDSSSCRALSLNEERALIRVQLVLKEERARLGLSNGFPVLA